MVRKLFLAFLSVFLLTSMVFAYDANNRVYESPTKVGDALIYPVFYADDGSQTSFEVINTSDNYSVVAKVVFRSKKYSQELLDFLIYLTPNDVFTMDVKMVDGKITVVTTDDSRCFGWTDGQGGSHFECADSVTGGFSKELSTANLCVSEGDTEKIGYVEVVESWATNDLPRNPDGTVNKEDLYNAYQPLINPSAVDIDPEETVNTLTGNAEIAFGSFRIGYAATALAGYDNNGALNLSDETNILTSGKNSAYEVEAALAKVNFNLPYYKNNGDGSLAVINFPTKKMYGECDDKKAEGPLFENYENNTDYRVTYEYQVYNLKELTHKCTQIYDWSPIPEDQATGAHDLGACVGYFDSEVNFMPVDSVLETDMGWARLNFGTPTASGLANNNTDNVTYTGVPSIGLLLQFHDGVPYFVEPSYKIVKPTYAGNPVWPFAPGTGVSELGNDSY